MPNIYKKHKFLEEEEKKEAQHDIIEDFEKERKVIDDIFNDLN